MSLHASYIQRLLNGLTAQKLENWLEQTSGSPIKRHQNSHTSNFYIEPSATSCKSFTSLTEAPIYTSSKTGLLSLYVFVLIYI